MKKIIGVVLLLMLAVGMLTGTGAHAVPGGVCGDAGTPVDVSCTNPDPEGAPSCELWVAPGTTGDPQVDNCHVFSG